MAPNGYKTVNVREDLHEELTLLKECLGFKTYDDLIKWIISEGIGGASMEDLLPSAYRYRTMKT